MDFVFGLPMSHGFNCIMTVVDRATKRVVLTPVHESITAPKVADLFFYMYLECLACPSASFWTGIRGSYHISTSTSFVGWGLVCYIALQTIHRQMVNQRRHTRLLNRYYVVMYSHAQTPGMNVCCFVKYASTVMPAAAPLCHPTY